VRRITIAVVLALGALGCSDSITPPNVPKSTQGVVVSATDIQTQLAALLPAGGLLSAASAQFDNVQKSWNSSPRRTDIARQQAAALCKFVTKLADGDKLRDPYRKGAAETADALNTLCSSLNLFVDLSPTGVDVNSPNAIAVFVPNDPDGTAPTLVLLPNKHAGVLIPQGAFGEDVTVIISPIADGVRPLVAPAGQQFPYFYEIQTVPAVQHFLLNVDVGVCTDESIPHPAGRLRLAHNVNNNTQLEVLPPVAIDFLDCDTPIDGVAMAPRIDRDVLFSRQLFAAAAQGARYLGSRAARFVMPTTAYATNIQLGGSSGSFSPFGGYDPGPSTASAFIDFETVPSGTPAAGPLPSCSLCIVTTQYSSYGVLFSWESTTWPSPDYGATLTSNSAYNDAAANGSNHVVTTAINSDGQGLSGIVTMTFAGQPSVVEYDRSVPTSGGALTTVTDGLGSTSAALVTVTPVTTFTSVAGYPMERQHVRIAAAAGIASIALDMNGTIQTIDNLQLNPVSITSLSLASTSLVVGGAATTYTAVISNGGPALSNVVFQGWIVQGATRRAAGGVIASCPVADGQLPTGNCTSTFSVSASNSAAGSGTFLSGDAVYVLEVLQNTPTGQIVLARRSVPVVLSGGGSSSTGGGGGSGLS